jgi:predicted Rossmann fold flavoprotein
MKYDAIIIGGGAAGLFCAIHAGKRRRKVLVIEHNAQAGRKILISGGGRCNFTNIHTSPANFVSQNPHFCKSALARYTPLDFIDLVREHKIEYYEKKLGQLFCRESSRQIVDMLLRECEQARVEVLTGCSVRDVKRDEARVFELDTDQGVFNSENLVIATGGLSFSKIGATDLGYRVAKQFGLKMVETRPGLVPLVFAGGKGLSELAGISVDSIVTACSHEFRENILFTHRGLSGPAILQASNYLDKSRTVTIDLLPDVSFEALVEAAAESRQTAENFLGRYLPSRAAEALTPPELKTRSMNRIGRKDIAALIDTLKSWDLQIGETEGYHKAEVTLGGISTVELSSQTMESRRVPGLYFIGEVVDVTGWLGGYNFQWAWSSGFAAGQAI